MMQLTDDQKRAIQRLIWEEKYIIHHVIKGVNHCHINKNKRFNTWTFKGGGSKNYLKQFLAFERDYKCIAQIQDKNGYRQFMPFKSWQDCWKVYETTGYRHRYLYELIISDNVCKPYLDIEWKKEKNENIELEPIITKLKDDLINVFLKRYNIDLNKNSILVASSHGETKLSFHVIINHIIDNKYFVYQTNRKREPNSAWDLYHALVEINKDYANKIDESVYSLDREFRAIYSTKYGDYRQLVPYPSVGKRFCDNYLDYFVTHFNDGAKFCIIQTPDYISPKLNVIKKVNKMIEIKGNHVIDFKRKETKVDQDLLDRIYELLQFIHPTAYFTGMTQDNNGWRFSYADKSEPCYTGHTHKSNGFAIFIKPSNGNIYIYCYSTKCGKLYKLGNLHYDIKWKNEAYRLNQQYLDYKTNIKVMSVFDTEDVKLSGMINNFIENGGNYVIKSGMGTGKTQLLKTILKEKFKDKRILYLSHRQTFTQNVFGSLKELGFYNYLDSISDVSKQDKLILQLDSLKHLVDINILRYYDLIILDEIESLLNHLSSPTLADKRALTCMILDKLIKKAKWVLSMDADFCNRGYDFLTKIKDKPKIILNEYLSVKKQFLFNSNYESRCLQIVEDVKNNKKIVIISLSKNTIDDIYNKIMAIGKDIKIIRYTSMTDDEQKKLLANVNEEWIKYQVVMYSPTIEAGVDFNEKYFNKMYCFLNNGSCSARSFLQMVGRVRTLADNKIRCHYDKAMKFIDKKAYIPSIDEVEQLIINNDYLINNTMIEDIDDQSCRLITKQDAFTRTFAHNYLETYEKMVHFLPVLKELIIEHEWEYLNEDAGEKEEAFQEAQSNTFNIHENKSVESKNVSIDSTHEATEPDINIYEQNDATNYQTSKKTVEMDDLLEAPNLTNEEAAEYMQLKNTNNLTRLQKLSLRKYWLKKKFNLQYEDITMEFLLNWYGKEYILDNAMYACGKKKIENSQDPYLNNIREKIDYLNQFLNIYGFKNMFDFESILTKDEAMENRMKNSCLLEQNNYDKIMKAFCKKMRRDEKYKNKFSFDVFTKLADAVFNEFGIGLVCKKKRKRKNDKLYYEINYKLIETRQQLIVIIKNCSPKV